MEVIKYAHNRELVGMFGDDTPFYTSGISHGIAECAVLCSSEYTFYVMGSPK